MRGRSYSKGLLILCSTVVLSLWHTGAVVTAKAEVKGSVASKPVDPYAVGCVLPLSGPFAAAGNRALDAIILASGVFDPVVKTPIKLVIEDSEGRPETARAAVAKLALEDGVICILGPLGADESGGAAREAQRLKVPIITLSRSDGITDIGNYVFRSYLTGRMEVESLVKYAIQEMALSRFAVLYPDNDYGREMEKMFRAEVIRRKGAVVKVIPYKTTETDFADEIKSISDLKNSSPAKRTESPVGEGRPDAGFDALFIPDSPERIRMIVPQLAFHDVMGVKLFGTSAWDTPEISKVSSDFHGEVIFPDAFSPNSYLPEANDFTDAYYTSYSREPDALEALAYDAAGIVVKSLLGNGVKTRSQFRANLLDMKNYRGVTGKISFAEGRDARKDVFILTIRDGQVIQIK